MATNNMNGRVTTVFDFLRRVEPGVILFIGIAALGFIINMNREQHIQSTSLALMQRDIATINERMASPTYTPAGAVSMELHREQIQAIHRRQGETASEIDRIWTRLNEHEDSD